MSLFSLLFSIRCFLFYVRTKQVLKDHVVLMAFSLLIYVIIFLSCLFDFTTPILDDLLSSIAFLMQVILKDQGHIF